MLTLRKKLLELKYCNRMNCKHKILQLIILFSKFR